MYVRSMVAPRRGDRRLLARYAALADRPLPPARGTVRLQTLRQRPRPVPSRLTFERLAGADQLSLQSFVIHHREATILLDPAFPREVNRQVMRELQPMLRRAVQPPSDLLPTMDALREAGIDPDLAHSTHAHWDHVSGLLDLPGLPAVMHADEIAWAAEGERAPVGGVRRGLAGRELLEFSLDGPPILTFDRSHDLFGDGTVRLVDLAGHTPGSVGVLLATDGGPVLLVGDTAWHGLQIDELRQRSGYPGCLADEDRELTWRALHRLHVLQEQLPVVPAHDHQRAAAWRTGL
ncbi:glyoxylase-like metal-dependent hydrolase (beta-lactamase superfamily II) [Naumannella cuiyingiana]|uniref:Glyoxylase-like metal-dependent hydrolase (Beta-lactamase superfamily II) n=1 Tax=Naumannella cuiyingiana TaxID=1347891 RepID=A0A7Z0DBL3_9ACTN|nr:MBL fold metallo-hydrolase [Naumannella cuiyingiana]NYI72595.1 glyoxylase-like metal-dependent hydrolase (beta-lactamase superfamily II) [Naumannella cuiyingiana]